MSKQYDYFKYVALQVTFAVIPETLLECNVLFPEVAVCKHDTIHVVIKSTRKHSTRHMQLATELL